MRRRRFLAQVACGAALAGTAGGGALERALAVPAARRSGTLRDVEHVVVLMQENRSFDHYFGWLNGVRGFADPFPLPLPGGRSVWLQPRDPGQARPPEASPYIAPYRLDTEHQFALMRADGTPHRWIDAQQAWDHGRMADWPAAKRNHSMAYFGRHALAFQVALAEAFTLCDAYHCSFQGGTHPNRYFLNTGTIDPSGRGGGPALYNDFDDFGPAQGPGSDAGYKWTTYAERLQAAGLSWHVYQDLADNFGDNSLAGFRRFRDAFHGRSHGDEALAKRGGGSGGLGRLRADVVAGRLPAVSWIVGTAEGSEHPWKSSPAQGADYTAAVIDALTADPEVWARTVLFVNYDENDGFFDHVPPPAPPSLAQRADGRFDPAGRSTVDTTGEYHLRLPAGLDRAEEAAMLGRAYGLGPRVPMFVVSPWSRGGWVCSQVFDHTSVIRFIEARFGVHEPNISAWRRAVCGDLTRAFDFTAGRSRRPARVALPETAALARRARALPGTLLPPSPKQFEAPVQEPGARPARALPYDLHAHCPVARDDMVTLELHNRGSAAAVVHVVDRLRLLDLPRRYTIGPGEHLTDTWAPGPSGRHDLWLLGPNGWHRRVAGHGGDRAPQARLLAAPGGRSLLLHIANPRQAPLRVMVQAMAYGEGAPRFVAVPASGSRRIRLPLDQRHRWYDWQLTVPDEPGLLRRWAGHVENGRDSFTDPAMHGPAQLSGDGMAGPRPQSVLGASASPSAHRETSAPAGQRAQP